MYKLESKPLKGLDWQLRKTQSTWEAIIGTSHGTPGLTAVYNTHHTHIPQYLDVYDKVTVISAPLANFHFGMPKGSLSVQMLLGGNRGKGIQKAIYVRSKEADIRVSVKLTGSSQASWAADWKTSSFQLSKLLYFFLRLKMWTHETL